MLRLLLFILIHDTILATGQTFIKQGMDTVEDVNLLSPRSILRFIRFCITRVEILFGLGLNTISLTIWLIILSFADLSQAYPLDSLQYIVIAFFAKTFLKEDMHWLRWVGIALIVVGVAVVGIK
ncbi:MAG: EamA family transporter [Candidatus Omnitrophica bacterium]|nr:EamA family transporter [Candidatus Omnitrophota bacterium]